MARRRRGLVRSTLVNEPLDWNVRRRKETAYAVDVSAPAAAPVYRKKARRARAAALPVVRAVKGYAAKSRFGSVAKAVRRHTVGMRASDMKRELRHDPCVQRSLDRGRERFTSMLKRVGGSGGSFRRKTDLERMQRIKEECR